LTTGCISNDFPDGLFACAAPPDVCPPGYYCAADHSCWRNGHSSDGGRTPASTCPLPSVFLCDGFEAGLVDWGMSTQNSQVTIDDQRAYRGTHSLHVSSQPITTGSVYARLTHSGSPTGTAFMRAFMYLQGPLPRTDANLLQFAPSREILGGRVYNGGDAHLSLFSDSLYPSQTASLMLPLDRWVCVEWQVVTGSSGTIRVWMDGGELSDLQLPVTGTLELGSFAIGFDDIYPPLPRFDVWYDEIIVDGAPIGCTK
jgi:hypothetical protein